MHVANLVETSTGDLTDQEKKAYKTFIHGFKSIAKGQEHVKGRITLNTMVHLRMELGKAWDLAESLKEENW